MLSAALGLVLMVQLPLLSKATADTLTRPIAERAGATLNIPGFADFLAADGESVWVTNTDRVEQLRFDSPRPVATVAMPKPCGAMVADFGALWIASCAERAVYRIDLATHKIAAIIKTGLADPRGELSLASGAGSIWVLSDSAGQLARIDARTNEIVARIEVAPHSFATVFGFGSVWITTTGRRGATGPGSVQRIDPANNRVVATIPVGPVPRFLAAGENGVWTLNQGDGTVTRIDPTTNRLTATIDASGQGGGGDIAAGAGRVWVRATKTLLTEIDPSDNSIVARYGPPAGSGAVRVAGNRIWVTAHDVHKVWVLDASRSSRTREPRP